MRMRAGSCCHTSENSTCSPLMEYPVSINSLLNLSRILTPVKGTIKRKGRAFIVLFVELPLTAPCILWENWGWLRCHHFQMNSGVRAYIDLQIYRGLGFGLNCQTLVPASERKRGRLKAQTERQAHTDKQRRRSKYPQSKCRRWVMLPWQPVLRDTMRGEWYWRKSHYNH